MEVITKALGDAKAAKSLHASCAKHVQKPTSLTGKRRIEGSASASASAPKRARVDGAGDEPVASTDDVEDALAMPAVLDDALIKNRRVYTNRAPVLLAFAVELLRHTMPEQPDSSRLSLAQAVVSLNAQSKASSLGLEHDSKSYDQGWGAGQPKVTIMGRQVPILRRDGYACKENAGGKERPESPEKPATRGADSSRNSGSATWAASQPVTSRGSTFVAHATTVSEANSGPRLVQSLLQLKPELETASHNSWGLCLEQGGLRSGSSATHQASEDDGETGCGAFILRLLEEGKVNNTIVVVSRWFGGVMLGPDRWRLMRGCVLEALAERLRNRGQIGHDGHVALWGLDTLTGTAGGHSGPRSQAAEQAWDQSIPGVSIHRPESARQYLYKSFLSGPTEPGTGASSGKRKAKADREAELEDNLALVLGALRMLFESWAPHLTAEQLDRRAWDWYSSVRPQVATGPGGWGAKGWLDLDEILALRRKDNV